MEILIGNSWLNSGGNCSGAGVGRREREEVAWRQPEGWRSGVRLAWPRYRPSLECNYAFGFDVSPPVEPRDGEPPFHGD